MTLPRLAPYLAGAATLLAATSVGAGGSDAVCARDVLVARSMQRQTVDQLESAGDDEASRCRVWRRHVDTMRRIAGVYGRCLSGPERQQSVATVRSSETEFAFMIRTRCGGR